MTIPERRDCNRCPSARQNARPCAEMKGEPMLALIFYAFAIVIVVLHFTGFLKSHNLEWLVLVLAVAIFPAVIFL
jgi:low affinity Fe/Cu permease